MLDRKPIFDEVRQLLGRGFRPAEVSRLDGAIDRAIDPAIDRAIDPASGAETAAPLPGGLLPGRMLGSAGSRLIRKWEGCARQRADGRFEAYPDPGSASGEPWTIGWGSTGPDIHAGTVWTQAQCDARFNRDVVRYVREVDAEIGDAPTTPEQFDALVSFHYNTGAIATATLTRLHKAGQFAGAQAEFARWIYNDHQPMNGLKARRAEEAALYGRAA